MSDFVAGSSDCLADVIDDRDVASLIMFERYEAGLYSLATDNSPDFQNEREIP